MNKWLTDAKRLLIQRAPLLTDDHARQLAADLYRAWPDGAPQLALAKFFREVPLDWKGAPIETTAHGVRDALRNG